MTRTQGGSGFLFRHKLLTAALVVLMAVVVLVNDPDPPEVEDPTAASPSSAPAEEAAPKSQPGKPRPKRTASARPPGSRPRTFLVAYVVDGDTLVLGNGETVRLVGIDAPERGECGYDASTTDLARLVSGRRVRLTRSDEDRDRYGRLLRYVDVGGLDTGLRQIESGWAVARYDSRDGYGYHPREDVYVATDKAVPDKGCRRSGPVPFASAPRAGGCAPGYRPCVPPYPPDVDCADLGGSVQVSGSDPHGLDRDGDGVACE